MAPEHCTLWNIISGIIGLVIGSGLTLTITKSSKKNSVRQEGVVARGDVAGRDINKN